MPDYSYNNINPRPSLANLSSVHPEPRGATDRCAGSRDATSGGIACSSRAAGVAANRNRSPPHPFNRCVYKGLRIMFVDARQIEPDSTIKADVCIVGAGAAGITLAR